MDHLNRRPPDRTPCQSCDHPFGEHYLTFNGAASGCAHYPTCVCTGFVDRVR